MQYIQCIKMSRAVGDCPTVTNYAVKIFWWILDGNCSKVDKACTTVVAESVAIIQKVPRAI